MTRKLHNWSYQHVTNFLKENGFSFFEELKGSRQAWIKLQEGGEPDRIVEIGFRHGNYPEITIKTIIRQSGIVEKDWTEWAGSYRYKIGCAKMSNNKRLTNTRLITVLLVVFSLLRLQANDDLFKMPDNAAKELPSGVPRTLDTNGKVIYIEGTFTTRAYQNEALRLVIQEANKVATELQLPEALPITESNLVHVYIGPFGSVTNCKRSET